ETFEITEGATTVVFEFVNTSVNTAANGNNVPIRYDATFTTRESLAAALVDAVRGQVAAGVLHDLDPRHVGNGLIHLGGTPSHTVDTTGTATLSQDASKVGLNTAGAVAVRFLSHGSFTSNDVAKSIADAVNRATFHANPLLDVQALAAASRISFTGHITTQEQLAGLQITLQSRFDAGPVLSVTQGSAGFLDGQTLRIRDNQGVTRLFEFDLDGALIDPSAQRISIAGNVSAEVMAQRIGAAIGAAGFRVEVSVVGDEIHLTNDREVELGSGVSAVTASSQGLIISSSISPRPYLLDFPGANSDPGHRDIPEEVGNGVEQHINSNFADQGRDSTPGVTTILYNFRSDVGSGFSNVITDLQKQRAREAFQLWGNYLGVQFIESADQGITIATADPSALSLSGANVLNFASNNFRVRVDPSFATSLLLMDSTISWNSEYGDPASQVSGQTANNWFLNAMVGVGSLLGLELANDLPISNLMARFTAAFRYANAPDPEPVFPGNADILHGQHLYRPDGVDIDLYRFEIDLDEGRQGRFTAETFAERLPNASLLDTTLTLYRENPDGTREVLAVNDDYFSRDSLIEVSLSAGVYYIGVTASGNAIYDPTIADTGLGGKSQGQYELRLIFRSQVEDQHPIRDADGERSPLDGDTEGVAGGVYNFWFQTQPVDRIIEVLGDGRSFSDGQIITITNSNGAREDFEFNAIDGPNPGTAAGNVAISFRTGAGGGVVSTADEIATELATKISAVFGNDTSAANDDFAKAQGNRLVFNSSLFGHERQVQLSTNLTGLKVHGRTIFVDKTAGPNADGSAGKPFNNLARAGVTNAFSAAQPGDIIRVVGNGGTDGNLTTLNDNFAYEVGFGTLPGQILSDGTELAVPKGVTVMVEPGTVFKMRRSRIGVGSSSTTVDRSGGAFQVLGTPEHQVYFTSWLDQTIGLDTHPPVTSPGAGDWGGIVFRDDVDRAQSRVNLEDEGIFLNYVNHADIRYGGGGNVVIDSVQQVVNPIQIVQTRPTVTFNRITNSADSAMSATPDSFDESNFHSPRFQQGGEFTSDYQRVGPDIYANYLANNSNNGLFIRIETPAGDVQQPLTVSGRFDDTDIVHILSENLLIQGSGGSPFLDLSRPSLAQVSFTNEAGGFLNPFTTYSYKITFVDANGFEGRPSEVRTATTANNSALRLDGLPPASGDFIRRRIYRTDDPSQGYQLVAEINATDRVYIDNRPLLGTLLQRDPPAVSGVTLAASARGSLTAGVYNYRIVFVNAQGEEGASSDATSTVTLNNTGGVNLNNLPAATGEFVSRRLYRSTDGGIAPYYLAAELDATSTQYRDDGLTQGDILDVSSFGVIRARPSARLALDPGTVLKMEGSRIETGFKAQFIAEGVVGQEVIITSRLDDSYGVGGTFDTNNDNSQSNGEATPRPGNWGGLFLGPLSSGSIDHALIAYGGGITQDSGTFVGFNAIEVHQSELRLTNSILENNAEGVGGQGPLDRFGRGYNRPATIFVRGAQPIIVDNIIRDNNTLYDASKTAANLQLPVISINANSLISDSVVDIGRSRGLANRITEYGDNQGPLVRGNQLANNAINGMVIRGEELTSQSVWDDTDIVHVVTNQFDQQDSRNANRKWAFDEIVVPEHHTLGGLRLVSSSTESLVVKFLGAGQLNNTYNQNQDGLISNSNPYNGAGITVYGRPFEIEDRIGGTLQIVGQPGFPVVL
ncbi:MAG: hypothetical protein AB7F89_14900, partial [Pirellulaceae bacterium]